MMRSVLALLWFVIAASAQDHPYLVFSHVIATSWQPEAHRWMNFVAISSDGRTVAGNGNIPPGAAAGLGFWRFPEGDFLRSIPGDPLAISPDFHYLANDTGIWDLETGKNVFQISRQHILWNAAFSPSGGYVALVGSGLADGGHGAEIMVLRTSDGSLTASFRSRYTKALAFHPGNETLASGHWNSVTRWDLRTGAKLALLVSPQPPIDRTGYDRDGRYINGLGFTADGSVLAATSDDGELQLWETTTNKLRRSLKIGFGEGSNPAFSPDGKLVAAGTYGDGTVSLVDVSSGKILSQIQVSMFGCGSVVFSPDGRYLLTPSNGGLLNIGKHERGGTIRVFRVEP